MRPCDHAAVVEQVDAVLDARQAVGDLAEVALAEVLLALEVERAVVGRDDLEVVLHEARPELLPVRVLLAQRRGAHELRALEPVAHVVEAEEQVLRAGLGERLRPAVARAADGVEGVLRREVDDVHRDAGRLGQADDAVGRLALEDRVARDAVVVGVGLAVGDELGRDDVDRRPVLRVHHDQPAVLRGLLHRAEDVVVRAVEHARVRGEQLEVRHALGDERVHLGERVVVDVAHDHVEAVVDDRVALGLRVPRVEARAERSRRGTGPRSRRSSWCRRTPRPACRSRTCPSRTCRRTAAPCGCGRRSRPGSRTCRWRRSSRRRRCRRSRPAGRRGAPIAAIVSPSTSTSATYDPSAVTMVPLAIRVRIVPPRARGMPDGQRPAGRSTWRQS